MARAAAHRQPVWQQFLTWRGVPLIPSDKLPIVDGKTQILLLRVGEKRQGVVACSSQVWLVSKAQAVGALMGINRHGHRVPPGISLYCLLAVLTEDAVAVLDDVETGQVP